MGNSNSAKPINKRIFLQQIAVPIDQEKIISSGGRSSSDRSRESPRINPDEIQSKYGRKRDSFSYLKSSVDYQKKERTRGNIITKDYLKKIQGFDNPFQEVDLALETPRILKRYVFDEQKLGQGKFSEFGLEIVDEDNNTGKNQDKGDIMSAFQKHKVQMLQEEKSKQMSASKNFEVSRSPQKDEKSPIENQADESSSFPLERKFTRMATKLPVDPTPLRTTSSEETLSRNSKLTFSKGALKLESVAEKDERPKSLTKKRKTIMGQSPEEKGSRKSGFERTRTKQASVNQGKGNQGKKIILESDDDENLNEMKEIEPLMILTHQNVKPIKYIFNQKYMGERITDNDERFLAKRLPNLFKGLKKKGEEGEDVVEEGGEGKKRRNTRSPNGDKLAESQTKVKTDQSQRFSVAESLQKKKKLTQKIAES